MALYYPWYDSAPGSTGRLPTCRPSRTVRPRPPPSRGTSAGRARPGIDVLVSAWFGPQDDNPTETNFKKLLSDAERAGLKAALLLETDSDEFFRYAGRLVLALRQFLFVHATSPPT